MLLRSSNVKIQTETLPAFGAFYIDVKEAFQLTGHERLKFKNVGYGGVNFLGNINGLSPLQGLYYQSEAIKKEVESFIISLQEIRQNQDDAVNVIELEHGKPIPEHSILWFKA
jgi:hypothetical protein